MPDEVLRATLVYYIRRLDPVGLVAGLWRLWRFNRRLREWDKRRGFR